MMLISLESSVSRCRDFSLGTSLTEVTSDTESSDGNQARVSHPLPILLSVLPLDKLLTQAGKEAEEMWNTDVYIMLSSVFVTDSEPRGNFTVSHDSVCQSHWL